MGTVEGAAAGYDGARNGDRGNVAATLAVSERVQDAIDLLDAGDVGSAREILTALLERGP